MSLAGRSAAGRRNHGGVRAIVLGRVSALSDVVSSRIQRPAFVHPQVAARGSAALRCPIRFRTTSIPMTRQQPVAASFDVLAEDLLGASARSLQTDRAAYPAVA